MTDSLAQMQGQREAPPREFVLLWHRASIGKHQPELRTAVDLLGGAARAELYEITGPESLREKLTQVGTRIAVICGGDGSAHHILNAAYNAAVLAPTIFGLLQFGTGNDLARNLDVPRNFKKACATLLNGHAAPIDLVVDDRNCVIVNSAHAALGAASVEAGAKYKARFGSLSYLIGGVAVGVKRLSWRVEITVDGKQLGGSQTNSALMLTIGNSTYDGGGLATTPGAKIDDGLLHVMVATPTKLQSKIWFGLALVARQHARLRRCVVRSGTQAAVRGELAWNDDGEPVGIMSNRTFHIVPNATRMIR